MQQIDIVMGANLGDEGKGTVVATLAKHAGGKVLNVLTNGGAQRAHSILTGDGSFTFQHFGSGTYYGADTYCSEYFILNPMAFVKEHSELVCRLGNKMSKAVYINTRCRWSTPFDMMANAIIEQLRGSESHGSCGMGIWETILRYNNIAGTRLSFGEFMSLTPDRMVEHLLDVKCYYERERIKCEIPKEYAGPWNSMELIYHFIDDCHYFHRKTIPAVNLDAILAANDYARIIFENGQGLMLTDRGTDTAGTTPSDTGCGYAGKIIGNSWLLARDKRDTKLHYVTRSYLTRHGKGNLEGEVYRTGLAGAIEEDRTNHYNNFQGQFRYAPLSIPDLKTAVETDALRCPGEVVLEVTHCDEMDRAREFKKLFDNVNTYDSPLIK